MDKQDQQSRIDSNSTYSMVFTLYGIRLPDHSVTGCKLKSKSRIAAATINTRFKVSSSNQQQCCENETITVLRYVSGNWDKYLLPINTRMTGEGHRYTLFTISADRSFLSVSHDENENELVPKTINRRKPHILFTG